ncbi:hypothetical protein DC522_22430 [Microvirga sp. KLBC 81]|uniref:hypothetical protein n=1 Tax=Microvirga sp. KLBC 81 TaxID=1862707 RepID=UPI000D5123AB|nr:hypothetical protein [Microvirga sp. KLBC 81]PVE22168.1 hypothetical protein DC522_22430 [Microvirga sp. KLBC 81]
MPPVKKKPSRSRSSLRFEPPTLDEAIFAAQGLANDVEGQTEIAAMLMGLPETEVKAAVLKAAAPAACTPSRLSTSPRPASGRQVVVERRGPRAMMRRGMDHAPHN